MSYTTARSFEVVNHDTGDAHPLDHIRDVLDWYEGLFAWGERWRDIALRLGAKEA